MQTPTSLQIFQTKENLSNVSLGHTAPCDLFQRWLNQGCTPIYIQGLFFNQFLPFFFWLFSENGQLLMLCVGYSFYSNFQRAKKNLCPYVSTVLFGAGLMVQGWRISHPRLFSVYWIFFDSATAVLN